MVGSPATRADRRPACPTRASAGARSARSIVRPASCQATVGPSAAVAPASAVAELGGAARRRRRRARAPRPPRRAPPRSRRCPGGSPTRTSSSASQATAASVSGSAPARPPAPAVRRHAALDRPDAGAAARPARAGGAGARRPRPTAPRRSPPRTRPRCRRCRRTRPRPRRYIDVAARRPASSPASAKRRQASRAPRRYAASSASRLRPWPNSPRPRPRRSARSLGSPLAADSMRSTKLRQRALGPQFDGAAEGSGQRPAVGRHLAPDRVHDLVRQAGQHRTQGRGHLARERGEQLGLGPGRRGVSTLHESSVTADVITRHLTARTIGNRQKTCARTSAAFRQAAGARSGHADLHAHRLPHPRASAALGRDQRRPPAPTSAHPTPSSSSNAPSGQTRAERIANLAGVVLPFAGLLAAIVLLWNRAVDEIDLAPARRAPTCRSGFAHHDRLPPAAHPPRLPDPQAGRVRVRGRSARWPSRARCSTGSPTTASTTPTPTARAIPHSPHVGHGSRPQGPVARPHRLAVRDPGPGRLEALRPRPVRGPRACAASRAASRCWRCSAWPIPFALGWILHGSLAGRRCSGLVWGGLVRVFLLHHVTWSINSICHFFGRRRFDVDDQLDQRRLAGAALARRGLAPQPPRLPALGRARPALVGDRPLRRSSSACMERLGLAWNVVRISPERQAQQRSADRLSARRALRSRPEPAAHRQPRSTARRAMTEELPPREGRRLRRRARTAGRRACAPAPASACWPGCTAGWGRPTRRWPWRRPARRAPRGRRVDADPRRLRAHDREPVRVLPRHRARCGRRSRPPCAPSVPTCACARCGAGSAAERDEAHDGRRVGDGHRRSRPWGCARRCWSTACVVAPLTVGGGWCSTSTPSRWWPCWRASPSPSATPPRWTTSRWRARCARWSPTWPPPCRAPRRHAGAHRFAALQAARRAAAGQRHHGRGRGRRSPRRARASTPSASACSRRPPWPSASPCC